MGAPRLTALKGKKSRGKLFEEKQSSAFNSPDQDCFHDMKNNGKLITQELAHAN